MIGNVMRNLPMPSHCVIFDLDGTLVDSEQLCNQAFLDLLPDLNEPVSALVDQYRGRKLADILRDIERRLDTLLPSDFECRYRERVAQLFETSLEPTPGTVEMLEASTFPRCVASGGPRVKIQHALDVSGLAKYFAGNIFSSYEIGSWKPEPDLFLYASQQMGFLPNRCLVVEDSGVGLMAAAAAGIRFLHYAPDGRASDPRTNGILRHMSELPRFLQQIST